MKLTDAFNVLSRKPIPSHYDTGTIATIGRPRDIFMGAPQYDYDQQHVIPRFPLAYITMYQSMYQNLPWRFAIQTKIQEKYRKGLEVQAKFSAKCLECDREYKKLKPTQKCPNCNGKMRGPDQKEKDRIEELILNMNLNGESLLDIMEMCHEDICVADQGYLVYRKEYVYDKTGHIKYQRVKETVWGSAIVMRPVVDLHVGTPGGLWYVCPGEHRNDLDTIVHREKRENPNPHVPTGQRQETEVDAPRCSKCGMVMRDVHYVSVFHERGQPEQYFIEGEVYSWSEYKKTHTITVPPGLTLWVATSIITYKDAYIRDSYMKQRKPRGALVVNTSNPEDFMNQWDTIMEKVKNDWHYMPVVPVEPEPGVSSSSASRIAWVDFMGTMMDLDYKTIREIYERQIYQWYGISNIFANIETGPGGKGGTESRLIVENRHVERSNLNDERHPLLSVACQFGMEDYRLAVICSEVRDIEKELQVDSHKITNAQLMTQLGYEADFQEEDEEFSFRKNREREITETISALQALVSLKTGGQGGGMGGMPPTPGGQGPGQGQAPSPVKVAKPKVNTNEFSGTGVDKGFYDHEAELEAGIKHEIEDGHTTDKEEAKKIALDHLKTIPDYYSRLARMERGFEDEKQFYYEELNKGVLGDTAMHEGDNKATKPTVNNPGAMTGPYTAPDGRSFQTKQALGGYMRSRNSVNGKPGSSNGMDAGMGPQMGGTREDYKLAMKQLRKLKIKSKEVLDAVEEMIDAMEDPDEALGQGVLAPTQPGVPQGRAGKPDDKADGIPGGKGN